MKIEKLLEKVKAGDTDALKIIYERYSPMMRSICFSITKEDEDTINDLVQDAFVLTYYSLIFMLILKVWRYCCRISRCPW